MDNKNIKFDNNKYELIKNLSDSTFESRYLVHEAEVSAQEIAEESAQEIANETEPNEKKTNETKSNEKKSNEKKKYILRRIKKNVDKQDLKEVLKDFIVLSRIRCDNLVQDVVRYFIENKQLYCLISYYDEINLKDYLLKNTLTRELKYTFCIDLAFSLDYLHIHLQSHLKIYPS